MHSADRGSITPSHLRELALTLHRSRCMELCLKADAQAVHMCDLLGCKSQERSDISEICQKGVSAAVPVRSVMRLHSVLCTCFRATHPPASCDDPCLSISASGRLLMGLRLTLQRAGTCEREPPATRTPCRYVANGGAAAPGVSSSAYAQGPSASSPGSNTAPGLYATGMELPGALPCTLPGRRTWVLRATHMGAQGDAHGCS